MRVKEIWNQKQIALKKLLTRDTKQLPKNQSSNFVVIYMPTSTFWDVIIIILIIIIMQILNPYSISTGSAIFAQKTAECPYALQWAAPSPPPENCPFPWEDVDPQLGSTQVLNPNDILISSAIFAGLTTATDRLTDHTFGV